MRVSHVIQTDDEIRAGMKAANASARDISAAMDARRKRSNDEQARYDKKTSAPFVASLQRQNQ